MKRITLQKVKLDNKVLRLKPVPKPPANTIVIDEPTIAYCDGKPAIGYYIVNRDLRVLKDVLMKIKYSKTERTGGLPTRSRIFGCAPRVTIRKDFCSKCMFSIEDPHADAVLQEFGKVAEHYYKLTNPEVHAYHKRMVEGILPDWRMKGSIWTQGIVNWNNQLRYHMDQGNFANTWNAMFTFRKDVEGGYLHIPEYNVSLACQDASVSVFHAQNVLHGVTPIRLKTLSAYRYTIVYYSLSQLTKCLSPEEELKRIKMIKTKREKARA